MKRRGMVDMIYNEDYYLLLHTNYKRSGPFREDFFCFSYSKSMRTKDPGEGPSFTPRSMNDRIYVYLIIILLHTNIHALGIAVLEKNISPFSAYDR